MRERIFYCDLDELFAFAAALTNRTLDFVERRGLTSMNVPYYSVVNDSFLIKDAVRGWRLIQQECAQRSESLRVLLERHLRLTAHLVW